MDSLLRIALMMVMTVEALVVNGQPHYQVKLDTPLRFTYRSGRANQLADGSCCAASETPPCTLPCTDICVAVCFREEDHSMDDANFNDCPLGRTTFSSPFSDTGTISFQASVNATTTNYPGSLQYLFRISTSQSESEKLIDSGRRVISFLPTDRDKPVFRSVFKDGENSIARIIIYRLAITCKIGYTGSNCGVEECVPRNDETGHFTCDISHNRVCLPGYQNPATYCIDQVPQLTTEVMTKIPTTAIEATTIAPTIETSFTTQATTIPSSNDLTRTISATDFEEKIAMPTSSSDGEETTLLPKTELVYTSTTFTEASTGNDKATEGDIITTLGDPVQGHTDLEMTAAETVETQSTIPEQVAMLPPPFELDVSAIAGGVAGGLVLMLLLITIIVLVTVIIRMRRKAEAKTITERQQANDQVTAETSQITGNTGDNHIPMERNIAYNPVGVKEDVHITMENNFEEVEIQHTSGCEPESYSYYENVDHWN